MSQVSAQPRVFANGQFRTSRLQSTGATWIAVENGRITALGSGRAFEKLQPREVVDLKNQFVFPGLTDSHAHLTDLGESMFQVDLRGSTSAEEAANRVRHFIEKNPESGPIVGQGWDQTDWPGKKFPEKDLLDGISLERPIVLYRVDGHAAWVNSRALKQSGLGEAKEDPAGGKIVRNAFLQPTGILIDKAMAPLDALFAAPAPERLEKYLQLATQEALKQGITSVHDAGVTKPQLQAIKNLLSSQRVKFRFYEMASARDEATLTEILNAGPLIDSENGQLTLRTVKFFADGAMGSRGAAFEKPYSDDPENSGLLQMTSNQMVEQFRRVDQKGFQIAVHAIGSLANQQALDAFVTALGSQVAEKRPRLEHAQVLTQSDITRAAKLGVIASMQPVHCTSDMKWVVDRIGIERAKFSYAWKSLLQAKVRLAFGSDAPVELINPWHGLFASITRQDANLLPPQGFFPDQRLTREEALSAFTRGGAFASFNEKNAGTLEKGKWADFFVTKDDPFKLSVKQLREMRVAATYVGGEKVYEDETPKVSP